MLQVDDAVGAQAPARLRGPRTAHAVLRLLALLARSEGAVSAGDAAQALGKSQSATYALLDALCAEGFAVHGEHGGYVLADPGRAVSLAHDGSEGPPTLAAAVDELFERTGKRAYLAVARSGHIVIPLVRGRQGVRRIPGLGEEIGDKAHALALGKVALSLLGPEALERYIAHGLRRLTSHTIVDPDVLRDELAVVRRTGVASDVEEYHDDVCCIAVPVYNGRRQAVAALGISMSPHCFETERPGLETTLRDVAQRTVPAMPEKPEES
jgi:IclR family acetate operon transcriptional repressor